jgi:hypothetical protein
MAPDGGCCRLWEVQLSCNRMCYNTTVQFAHPPQHSHATCHKLSDLRPQLLWQGCNMAAWYHLQRILGSHSGSAEISSLLGCDCRWASGWRRFEGSWYETRAPQQYSTTSQETRILHAICSAHIRVYLHILKLSAAGQSMTGWTVFNYATKSSSGHHKSRTLPVKHLFCDPI